MVGIVAVTHSSDAEYVCTYQWVDLSLTHIVCSLTLWAGSWTDSLQNPHRLNVSHAHA